MLNLRAIIFYPFRALNYIDLVLERKKNGGKPVHRLNFTLDDDTIKLLEFLSDNYYSGNKSQTVRAALEALAINHKHEGWVVAGYTVVDLEQGANCHQCGNAKKSGDVMYRPVFERGHGPNALNELPTHAWFDCPACVSNSNNHNIKS